ncbi:nucleotidyltransferase family protein [Brachybacterium halotolerans subsp. kimchii]|uniref:nucleotidyltransferase family protein n=1 Tax=Brachybacterium halotolerans TaxID=2795215 RepID=UPI001E505F8B|nr:nucleotidyltransferase family protein [Brachybacterium halotolerans]UEJ81117.1 nucleotidyltransferase family protein [Brachybacterium halotolerans subsp. kimchii]
MSSLPPLPVTVRLRLAHGCLDHLARDTGVRVLHVKGPALDPVLAEGRGPSSDCDILVEPGRAEDFCAALRSHGWDQVTSFEHGSVLGHAATFHHTTWGTVDVHRSFPGLDSDPGATFSRMWSGRRLIELGGQQCAVPALEMQRLVLLVHAARDAMGRRAHDVRVAWDSLDDDGRDRLDSLADELGGRVPIALVTDRPERARGVRGVALWTALHEKASPSAVWWARLREAGSMRERLEVLGAALRLNPEHLALRLGHPPTPAELRRESWGRWGRAARHALHRAARVVRH